MGYDKNGKPTLIPASQVVVDSSSGKTLKESIDNKELGNNVKNTLSGGETDASPSVAVVKSELNRRPTTQQVNEALDQKADKTAVNNKQDKLVSGQNIKTVGGISLLGSGNIPLPSDTGVKISQTVNPSDTANAPSSKAVADYVQAHGSSGANVVDNLNGNSTTDAPSVHAVKQALANLSNNPTGGNATNVVEMSRYSEIAYSADSVSPNIRILSDEIHSGDYVLFDFVIKDVSGAIKLYDENDNEIDTIGASNLSETMQHWQVKSKIPYNYSYAKTVWGRGLLNVKVLKAIRAINDDVELNIMPSSLNSFKLCKSWIEPFFIEEMETTLKTLDTLTRQNCIVMPILTDSHVGTTMNKYNSAYHTLANVRYLCQNVFCDAVAHLGDILQARWNDMWINQGYTQEATDEITYRAMSDYLGCLFTTNKHVYAVNGNHDGLNVQRFMSNRWYGLVGRRMNADNSIIKTNSAQSYYYVDFDKVKLRCIFLSVPDDNSVSGLTDEQLNWFASTALDVKEGYNVIILSHIPHIHENFTRNKDQYVGICNAFNAHSTYSTYDYTSLTHGEKIVCEFGGHLHAEKIYNIGEEYTSTNGVMRANLLPCASVFLPATAAITNSGAKGEYDCISHNRIVNTVSQDAFDTMVYAPNENKIYLVRFGVGEDRVILF